LSDATGEIHATAEAECHGLIRFSPAGHAGFGYDPLFEMPEYHRTFAELGDAVKSMLSHRARAMRQIVPSILRLLQA
jgi:XTP/dITP diphosphohydrolase